MDPAAAKAGVTLEIARGAHRARPGHRAAPARRCRLAARDGPPRPADPRRLEPGGGPARAGRGQARPAGLPALGRRCRRSRAHHPHDRGAGRRARRPRWSRCSCRPPRRPPAASRCFAGTTEVILGEDARLEMASVQELGAGHGRVPAPGRPDRRPARRSTGRSPRSAAGWSAAASTTGSRATARSVEQVEIVFGGERAALRPDVLHDARRPRHDRQPAVEGRAPRSRADATSRA